MEKEKTRTRLRVLEVSVWTHGSWYTKIQKYRYIGGCIQLCNVYTLACLLRGLGSRNNKTAINNLVSRSWFLNTILYQKEPGLVGEMADSKVGTGKVWTEPGTSCCARKKCWKNDGDTSKGHRSQLERPSTS